MDYRTVCDLTLAANLVALGAWAALALVCGFLALHFVRRCPREALLVALLTGVAFLIRLLSSPRLPVLPGHQDFTHIWAAATWMQEGLGVFSGLAYPATGRVLIYGWFGLFGPSLEGPFWLFTVLGSLTTLPVYLVARRLSGSVLTGALAAACFAAMPAAVFFNNGVGLESVAGLLLVGNFGFFVRLIEHTKIIPGSMPPAVAGFFRCSADEESAFVRHADKAGYLLTLLLFSQVRGEGLGMAGLVVLVQVAVALGMGKWTGRGTWRGMGIRLLAQWRLGLFGCFLSLPWLLLMLGADGGQAADEYLMRMLLASGLAVAVMALAFAVQRWETRWWWAGLAWDGVVLGGGLYLLAQAFLAAPGNPFLSVAQTSQQVPYLTFYASEAHFSEGRFFVLSPGVFPLLYTLLIPFGLLRARRAISVPPVGGPTASPSVTAASPSVTAASPSVTATSPGVTANSPSVTLAAALLLLPILAHLTITLRSGNATAEGVRYFVPYLGLMAVVVGLGGQRLIGWASLWGHRWQAIAAALMVLLLLSPTLTHHAFTTDTRHNLQNEDEFVRSFVDQLPVGATVLYPDFRVSTGPSQPPESPASIFRLTDMLKGMAYIEGTSVIPQGISSLAERTSGEMRGQHALGPSNEVARSSAPLYLYLGVDCYRVPAPGEVHPWCQQAPRLGGIDLVSSVVIPNRVYCGAEPGLLGPRAPELTMALYKVDPEGVANLRLLVAGDEE